MEKAILFDLDGTLLPMDNAYFTKCYFKLLCQTAAPLGYEPQKLVDALWKGVKAMVMNDGSQTNFSAFWKAFAVIFGEKAYEDIPKFDAFYTSEFQKAIAATSPTELAKEAVQAAREKAEKVILATNPIFPKVAVDTRLGWLGLKASDFDLVTTYENSCHCKPNPAYYRDILYAMNLEPWNCIMVGNDIKEDYKAAASIGITTYIVKDYAIGDIAEINGTNCGTYFEMIQYLKTL